jgi:hypothetical protein
VTEFCYLLSQSVGLDPGDEYQFMILDSVGDGMCCGSGDESSALYPIVDASNVLLAASNGAPVRSSTKSMRMYRASYLE